MRIHKLSLYLSSQQTNQTTQIYTRTCSEQFRGLVLNC